MKLKITKKKMVIFIILLLIVLIPLPTFSRYIYNNVRDLYLKSRNFSFSSNLLTNMGKTYRYSNWSGVDNYEIDFQLYSYESELSLFKYEGEGLSYNITCELDDETKATAHVQSVEASSTESGYIPNLNNIKDVKIFLTPNGILEKGDTVRLTVKASTETPYKKQISATFVIRVTGQSITYSIEDSPNSIYATLKLVNTKNTVNQIKIEFDPKKVLIDTSDEYYTNKISETSQAISGVDYVNSITFNMEAEESKNIIFYKTDQTQDYTYPSGNGSMIITVTEN